MTKKTLKDFLEVYKPKSPDEQKFVDKHVVIKHKDRNGNGDDVFKGNTKTIKRKEERHGYDVGEDEKVYEALKGNQHKIDANKNGKVDAHDFHLLRKKKKVAEETEEVDESYQELMALKNNIARNEKKMNSIPGIHPEKKRLAIQIEKDTKRHKALFNKQMGKNEEVDIDTVLDEALDLLMSIDEKTLTSAEMKKREEVVKAIKRDDPKMDKSMAYAIATKTAKRVAEGAMPTADEPTDANKKTAQRIRDLLAKEKKPVKEEAEELDEMSSYEVTGEHTDGHLKTLSYFAKSPAHAKSQFHAKQSKKDYTVKSVKKLAESAELDESAKIAAHLIKRYGDNVRKSHVVSAANDFGVDASKLAKAVRTKLGKTSLAEEEQIDELSVKTLDNYRTKARKDIIDTDDSDETRINKRAKGYMDASKQVQKKLAKEEIELDELSVAKLKDYRTKARADAYDADDVDDERRYRKRAAGSNTAGKKIVRQGGSLRAEEAEGLDELSKGKMQDYMDKASDARGHRNLSTKKVDNRYAGVKKASDKITTEEQMSPEDHYKADLPHILKDIRGKRKGHSDLRREYGLSWKRLANSTAAEHGHDYNRSHLLAVGKQHMAKHMQEEVQINELSKKTLGSYVKRASTQAFSKAYASGAQAQRPEDEKAAEKNLMKANKRVLGVHTAVSKLTKEDIINRTIDKYVPEELKFTPEERLLKRLGGLSEAHVDTLLGLFEDLNKDNQNKMIETVETRDGINQLLNFVLENRGK